MKKILDGFTHRRGMHCDTTALRDVFAHSGHESPSRHSSASAKGWGFSTGTART
jgi:hypothetical protein